MIHTQPVPQPFADFNSPQPNRLALKNGVPFVGLHNPDLELIRLDIRLLAGSCFQQKPAVSAAALKLLTEGTSLLSAEEIAEKLDYAGAYFEALADRDFSTLSIYFPKDASSVVLNILKQLFTDAVFPQEKIRIYQNINKKNLAISLEKTAYLSYTHFISTVFGDAHPYGFSVSLSDIEAITREDIVSFYQSHFHAGNLRIFAAGNLDDALLSLLNDTLGQLHSKKANTPDFAPSKPQPSPIYIERENALQSSICIGKELFNRNHKDWEQVTVLNTVLGAYFGSRLMTNIREDKGLAYGIYSRMTSFLRNGLFLIAADVNKSEVKQATEEIYKELRLLTEKEISEQELNLVKNYLYGSFLRNFDGLFSQIDNVIISDDYHLGDTYWKTCLETFKKVDTKTLLALANTYLHPDDMAEVVVG